MPNRVCLCDVCPVCVYLFHIFLFFIPWCRTVNYAADDISGFNAIVSKNGLSIHNLAQPILLANARTAAPYFQRSPLAKSVFLAPQVAYANLLQQQQQHTPAGTIEIVGPSNQFLPYSSVSYGFNANGQFWWNIYDWSSTLHFMWSLFSFSRELATNITTNSDTNEKPKHIYITVSPLTIQLIQLTKQHTIC